MMKKISILGCGWLGFPLAKHWKNNGYILQGSSRNIGKINLLEKEGIRPYQIDIEKKGSFELWKSFLESDILVITVPNKNLAAHRQVAEMMGGTPLKQIVFTSSTSVYTPDEYPITEKSKLVIDHPLLAIEKIYRSTGISTCVFRLSGLVGPDRHPGSFFQRRPKAILSQVPINLIHLNDVMQALDWVLDHTPCNEIFNITSVEHPQKFDFYSKAYAVYFHKPASFQLSEDRSGFKLVSGRNFEQVSGLKFSLRNRYPTLF